jgi:transcription elongation factor Elf1
MAKVSHELSPTFECPYCGHEITESQTRLKHDPEIICRRCGKPDED